MLSFECLTDEKHKYYCDLLKLNQSHNGEFCHIKQENQKNTSSCLSDEVRTLHKIVIFLHHGEAYVTSEFH